MVYCTKCGTKNNPTEKYCTKCGTPLETSNKNWEQKIEDGAEEFGKKAEQWGEEFGERAQQWGQKFEKHAQEQWRTITNIGAIFGVLIGIIILLAGVLLLAVLLRHFSNLPEKILAFGIIILLSALKALTKKT